jgi:hypothetical protein
MKPVRRLFVILLLVSLSAACASTGTGDPAVVRAEDWVVNSLSTYKAAIAWHDNHSTSESPAAYKAFEGVRAKFPPAWKAVKDGVDTYKINRAGGIPGKLDVQALIDSAQKILDDLAPYYGGK